MDLKLTGKKVLITGASQGIGEGLAHAFAGEGCHLHLTARSAEKLETLRTELTGTHRVTVTTTAVDMTRAGAGRRGATYQSVGQWSAMRRGPNNRVITTSSAPFIHTAEPWMVIASRC